MRDYDNNLKVAEPCVELCQEYKPTNQQALQEYEIRLQFLSRGCIVHVGCKAIAFETAESAMKEVNEYVKNTYETQKKWRKLLDTQENY
jgi:hypothetical protein